MLDNTKENPGVKLLEDSIARFLIERTAPKKSNDEKLKVLIGVEKQGILDDRVKYESNTCFHFCKFMFVYYINVYHPKHSIQYQNLFILLQDLYEEALVPDHSFKIKDLLLNAYTSPKVESVMSEESFPMLYTVSGDKQEHILILRDLEKYLNARSFDDEIEKAIWQINKVSSIYSKKLNGEPICWMHNNASREAAFTHGAAVYTNLILSNLHPIIARVKSNNSPQDKADLVRVVKAIKASNVLHLLFSDSEKQERRFFSKHLDALLMICVVSSGKEFRVDSYINQLMSRKEVAETQIACFIIEKNGLPGLFTTTFIQSAELTPEFLTLFAQKAQALASLESFKTLIDFCNDLFPNDRDLFSGLLTQRLKDDEVKEEKQKQRLALKEAELVEQNAKSAEIETLIKLRAIKEDQKDAEERANENAERRLVADLHAQEEQSLQTSSSSSESSGHSFVLVRNQFNRNATWNNGGVVIRADQHDVYKVGISDDVDFKQYVLLSADLMESFGVKIIDDQFIARATTALGVPGFKTYNTPDNRAIVVEIKSLSANNGGDRIYFAQMLINENNEKLYIAAKLGKHNANIACIGASL